MPTDRELQMILSAKDKASGVFKDVSGNILQMGANATSTFARIRDVAAGVFTANMFTGLVRSLAGANGAIAQSIGAASDLDETVTKVGVVFDDQAAAVRSFGQNSATALGMSQNAALAAAGTYGNLFRAMGMSSEVSAEMSTKLVQLAADLASFNNIDPTVALDKLRAGLSGETEPLKTLGVNLNQATIQAKAMQMGLIRSGDVLSAAAKAQASYALILEQTTLAQGDFARTSDGVANQQRILKARFEDLQASIGQGLSAGLRAALPAVNELLTAIGTLAASADFSAAIEGVAVAAGKFAGVVVSVVEWLLQLEPATIAVAGGMTALGLSLPGIVNGINAARTAFASLTALMATNPLVLAATAIVAAGLGIAAVIEAVSKREEEARQASLAFSDSLVAHAASYEQYKQALIDYEIEQGRLPAMIERTAAAEELLVAGTMKSREAFDGMKSVLRGPLGDALTGINEGLLSTGAAAGRASIGIAQVNPELNRQAGEFQKTTIAMDAYAARLTGLAKEHEVITKTLAEAFKAEAVSKAMESLAGVISKHNQTIAEQERAFQQSQLDAQFQFNLERAQAEQAYQQERATLVALGKNDEVKVLEGKFEQSQALASSQYSIQQQLQQRALLQQRITTQRAYIVELQEQGDQIRRVLAQEIIKASKTVEISELQQRQLLDLVYQGGSARLQMERAFGEQSAEVARLVASNQIESARTAVEAILQIQAGNLDAANAALGELENQLENFQVTLPPLPPLDMGAFTAGIQQAEHEATKAAKETSEPATKAMAEVVQSVQEGVKAAKAAIEDLLDFEVPEGVERGLAQLNTFIVRSVESLYSILDTIKPKLDVTAPILEPLTALFKLIGDVNGALKGVDTDQPLGDLAEWGARFYATLARTTDVLLHAHETLPDLEKASEMSGTVKAVLSITSVDFSKISQLTEMELPPMDTWGARFYAILARATDVLAHARATLGRTPLSQAAALSGDVKEVLSIVGVDFSKLGQLTALRMPDLGDWGARFYAVLYRAAEVLLHAKKTLPGIEGAAKTSAGVREVLGLVAVDFSKLGELTSRALPNLGDWGARVYAVLYRTAEVLLHARATLPTLSDAAETSAGVREVLGLVATDFEKLRGISDMKLPDLADWGARIYAVIQRLTEVLLHARRLLDQGLTDAAEVAGSVKEILALLGADLSGLAPVALPDLGQWGANLYAVIQRLYQVIAEARRRIGEDGLKAAAGLAESIGQMLGLVGAALDALKGLNDYQPGSGAVATWSRIQEDVEDLIIRIAWLARRMKDYAKPEAAEFAKTATEMIGLVKPSVEALTTLGGYDYKPGTIGIWALAQEDIEDLILRIAWLARRMEDYATPEAAAFAKSAGDMVGIIKPAIDALSALVDYKPVSDLKTKLANFTAQLASIIVGISDMAAGYDADAIASAATFAGNAKTIAEALKAGVDALDALAKYAGGSVAKKWDTFKAELADIVTKIGKLGGDLQGAPLEKARLFRGAALDIRDSIQAGLDAIAALEPAASAKSALADFAGAASKHLAAAVLSVRTAVSSLQGLFGSALVTLPPLAYALGAQLGAQLQAGWKSQLGDGLRITYDGKLVPSGSVLPPQQTTTTTTNYYLTAQYLYQSEASLRDTITALEMLNP